MNEKAYQSYLDWKAKLNMPVFIAFFLLDEKENLLENRLAVLGTHVPQKVNIKAWDGNGTVEFDNKLPGFTKGELLKYLLFT